MRWGGESWGGEGGSAGSLSPQEGAWAPGQCGGEGAEGSTLPTVSGPKSETKPEDTNLTEASQHLEQTP